MKKLFENIIDNLGKPKVKPKVKPFLTPGERRRGYAQLKKYAIQPDSRGVF